MADLVFRGNLNAANWPMLSTAHGRSVIVGQLDTNASRFAGFGGRDLDRDAGVPQVLYLQNAIPTQEGFSSVGYRQIIPGAPAGFTQFDRVFQLRDALDRRALFVPANGVCYLYNAVIADWHPFNSFALGQIGTTTPITTAFVQERQFICFKHLGIWEYNFNTHTFTKQTLIGLVDGDVSGIVSSSGYLIAFGGQNTVYWSSLTNPLDFVESIISGAGNGQVIDLRGQQVIYLPISNGFIAYSTANAVLAQYTGNIQIPWNFKEIAGSGGVVSAEHVTFEENLNFHYAWTSNGLLKVEKNVALPVHPQATDFLTSKTMEDFDYTSETLTTNPVGNSLVAKLTHIGNRYLIISYGASYFTHALIYDEAQERWGKLKIQHADCFAINPPNLFGEITYQMLLDAGKSYEDLLYTMYSELFTQEQSSADARDNIAFLKAEGNILVADFDANDTDDEGVILLGKFQVARNQEFTLHEVELESVMPTSAGANFAIKIWTSYNGKTLANLSTNPLLTVDVANLRKYEMRVTGINHTLMIKGCFSLCSLQLAGIQVGSK